jgi:hypothetical protein
VRTNYALTYPDLVPGWFNIGVLHTSCDGRPGRAVYAPCTADDLARRGYQYGNFRHSAWRRFVLSPSTARANRAGLPETRERGKLASNPEAIWGMSDKALLGRRSCVSS